jgi:hypothetical protein
VLPTDDSSIDADARTSANRNGATAASGYTAINLEETPTGGDKGTAVSGGSLVEAGSEGVAGLTATNVISTRTK